MSNEPPIVELRLCPFCGAACVKTAPTCWMCEAELPAAGVSVRSNATLRESSESALDPLFYALLIGCMGLTTLLAIGVAVEDPGALFGLLILVVPAFAVTGVKALWQVQATGRAQPAKLLLSFVLSIVVTIAVIIILAVAAAILLFAVCLRAFSAH